MTQALRFHPNPKKPGIALPRRAHCRAIGSETKVPFPATSPHEPEDKLFAWIDRIHRPETVRTT